MAAKETKYRVTLARGKMLYVDNLYQIAERLTTREIWDSHITVIYGGVIVGMIYPHNLLLEF